MEQVERLQAKRFLFLHRLYEKTNGNPLELIDMLELGNELGFTQDETQQIFTYLKHEGLLGLGTLSGGVRLSHDGIREIESSLTHPTIPTSHFPAINIINIFGGVHNSPIQQGTHESQQTSGVQPLPEIHQELHPSSTQSDQAQRIQTKTIPSPPHDNVLEFTDIQIVGFNDTMSRKLPDGTLEAFIELSADPPSEWASILREECQALRGTFSRPLDRFKGKYLILHDAYGGNGLQVYLGALKQDIQITNQRFRAKLERLQQEQARQETVELQEREELARLKSQLNLD